MNFDAKPHFDLIWAEYYIILLFFSETLKKDIISIFASFCNPALYSMY